MTVMPGFSMARRKRFARLIAVMADPEGNNVGGQLSLKAFFYKFIFLYIK
jgi:hypothetical protein